MWWRRVYKRVLELGLVVQILEFGLAVALLFLFDDELCLLSPLKVSRIGGTRAGGLGLGWSRTRPRSRQVCELGRVLCQHLEAKLLQFVLGERQLHVEDLEHLEFNLSNVPATEDASDVRPVAVAMRGVDGILEWGTGKISDCGSKREMWRTLVARISAPINSWCRIHSTAGTSK